ncbi:MAG: hypothetical protein MR902_04355 [Campylobacter sp.]|nr:hypothetical protein [Campylobacter sp.]
MRNLLNLKIVMIIWILGLILNLVNFFETLIYSKILGICWFLFSVLVCVLSFINSSSKPLKYAILNFVVMFFGAFFGTFVFGVGVSLEASIFAGIVGFSIMFGIGVL